MGPPPKAAHSRIGKPTQSGLSGSHARSDTSGLRSPQQTGARWKAGRYGTSGPLWKHWRQWWSTPVGGRGKRPAHRHRFIHRIDSWLLAGFGHYAAFLDNAVRYRGNCSREATVGGRQRRRKFSPARSCRPTEQERAEADEGKPEQHRSEDDQWRQNGTAFGHDGDGDQA